MESSTLTSVLPIHRLGLLAPKRKPLGLALGAGRRSCSLSTEGETAPAAQAGTCFGDVTDMIRAAWAPREALSEGAS